MMFLITAYVFFYLYVGNSENKIINISLLVIDHLVVSTNDGVIGMLFI